MCPLQLIQGEDVIIYQCLGLGRLFFQRDGMREGKKRSLNKEAPLVSSLYYVQPLCQPKGFR